MDILVVEDNYLVAEVLRIAVEDAGFNVVGPARSIEESRRLAEDSRLDGALLDIQLGGAQCFPIARLLRSNGVPFIFVTGYDSSVLPADLRDAPRLGKPVFANEITRIAVERFGPNSRARRNAASARIAQLRARIADTENRIATQRRRVERLQIQGVDPAGTHHASDLLEQMMTSADFMRARLRLLEDPAEPSAIERLESPVDDEIVDLGDPRSVEAWSRRLGIPAALLLETGREVGPSARTILRAVGRQQQTDGRPRKAS